MNDFIEFLIKTLVTNPDAVMVECMPMEDDSMRCTIKVHADDRGLVIGREGKMIRAIETLARVKAAKENLRIRLDVESLDEA